MNNREPHFYPKNRLEAFSDGVIAIVITILVLLIEVPENILDKKELLAQLGETAHIFMAYLISFIIVGYYWWNQHMLFHYAKKVNRGMVIVNFFFLLFLAVIPYPTDLLIEYMPYQTAEIAIIMYISVQVFVNLCLLIMWNILQGNDELRSVELSPGIFTGIRWVYIISILVFLAAIPLSFVSRYLAICLLLMVPVLGFLAEGKIRKTRFISETVVNR